MLKGKKLLQTYKPKATGIPEKVGAYPDQRPGRLLFRLRRLRLRHHVERALRQGQQAARRRRSGRISRKPAYFDHVSIAAPSRSGTTHLTIETILQGEGWDKGWRTIKEMAGNFRQVTERSFGVPEAVNSGQVGYGIVIDFFAFSSQASGFPVKFVYPTVTTIVPANVGIVANAPNKAGAEAFVEFLLSPAGQEVLLEPRHPPPAGQPDDLRQGAGRLSQSVQGSRACSALREVRRRRCRRSATTSSTRCSTSSITFQLDPLKAATKAIHEAEAALAKKDNAQARALVEGGARTDRRHAGRRGRPRPPARPPAPSPAASRKARARPSSSSNGRRSPRNVTRRPSQGRGSAEARAKLNVAWRSEITRVEMRH